jgi:hypothetical protein
MRIIVGGGDTAGACVRGETRTVRAHGPGRARLPDALQETA